jgi:hypothetical protein
MLQDDETGVICRLPKLKDFSLRQLLELDRRVLADVIRDELEDSARPESKMARFQNFLSP